jgi:hypothetical protein
MSFQGKRTWQIPGLHIGPDPDEPEKLFERIITIGRRQDTLG